MIFKIFKFVYRKCITIFFNILMNKKKIKLKHFGSKYGGWQFYDDTSLKHSTIVSCGVGEDISFDIEMINYYKLKVILVDPTPRSILYFDKIKKNLGSKKKGNYSHDGYQEIDCYDLSQIKLDDIVLLNKAIWNKSDEELKLYFPKDKSNVSLSVSNFSNNFKNDTDFIKVKTITYSELLKKFNITKLTLLKLDIEGAECDVILNLIENNLLPDQILVEFDELYTYDLKQLRKYLRLHNKLTKKNYLSVKTQHFSNQLYIKRECLKKSH